MAEDNSFSEDENNICFNDRYFFTIDGPRSSSTKVFTKEAITSARRKDIDKVIDVLLVNEHQARILLTHVRWNMDKLFDEIVNMGIDQVKSEAGATEMENYVLVSSAELDTVKCLICLRKVSTDLVTEMDCAHFFCNDCWIEYIIRKIEDGQSKGIGGIICMALKCNTLCDEAKIKHLLGSKDPELAAKFETLLLESYLEKNKNVKWCPKHCGNAVSLEGDKSSEVECLCGQQFCFNCLSEGHTPCSCLMWKLWAKRFEDESGTINWISENTNPCPRCHIPVEKDEAYNYMSCICGQVFCCICGHTPDDDNTKGCRTPDDDNMEVWRTSRSGHNCVKNAGYQNMDVQLAKKEPWRYMHYYNHYQAYKDLLEIESVLSETIQQNVSKLQRRDFPEELDPNILTHLNNCSWITDALFRLFRSRRFIAYAYVFAYYTFGDRFMSDKFNEKMELEQKLFEHQQMFLEENVERLSMLVETPFYWYSEDEIMKLRLDVITLSNIVDVLYKELYECIDNYDVFDPTQQSDQYIAPEKSDQYDVLGVERHDYDARKV